MIAQRDQHRQAGEHAEHERADRTPLSATALQLQFAARVAVDRRSGFGERALAFDDALRDIFRHRCRDVGDADALRQHLAAVAGVLKKTVDPLVAAHRDMGDGVDPEPRGLTTRNPAVEQVDLRRDFREQRIERLVEQLEPRNLGVVQIDDHAGALGGVDARPAQRLLQALRLVGLGRSRPPPDSLRPHIPTN